MPRHSDKPKPVSVYVRCRPRNTNEKNTGSPSIIQCSKKEVVVKQHNTNLNKKYTFDHVYGPESSQVDVYKGQLVKYTKWIHGTLVQVTTTLLIIVKQRWRKIERCWKVTWAQG